MENVKDWCISRQLWWGHRIPAYYIGDSNEYVVAESAKEALLLAKEKTGNVHLQISDLKQDEDVLDTWFSSWLWPVSVFDGIRNPQNKDIQYYYPTDDLITAPEILFFWVARMIIAGYEYMHEKPFRNVYLTGLVRDAKRVKMSKSLGNSPDPIELINNFSADGVRVGMLLCSPAGNDLLFDESLPEQGRNFANKIWNAFRLVKSWKVEPSVLQPEYARQAVSWFGERLNQAVSDVDLCFRQYRISDALMQLYRLFWDDFSSFYLEIIKPEYGSPIDNTTHHSTIDIFESLLRLLHPFMPFITEEIWHLVKPRSDKESIMVTRMPDIETFDSEILELFNNAREIIGFIRNTRAKNQISNKEKLNLSINSKHYRNHFDTVIIKLGNLSSINMIDHKPEGVVSLITKSGEYYIDLGDMVDHQDEIRKLEAELEYTKGFLGSVMKKLNNERFVSGAPGKVIETEKKKKADAETKIKGLEERLMMLRKGSNKS
jgi:valyl-tRNA synthetase